MKGLFHNDVIQGERVLKMEKFISQDIHVSLGQRVNKAILSVKVKLNKSITRITHSTSPDDHLPHLYRHYPYSTTPFGVRARTTF